jgi:hypothetical protein
MPKDLKPCNGDDRGFADVVSWKGDTTGKAVIQIRTSKTQQFQTVNLQGNMPLYAVILTRTADHYTTRHFALNKQLFPGHDLKRILPCKNYCPDGPYCGCTTSLVDIAGCSNNMWP